jgi:hypothetical protein
MFGETDLHNAVALDLLEKRKVTSTYEWEWYAAKKKNSQVNRLSAESAIGFGGRLQRR